MRAYQDRVLAAIKDLQQGKMIILVDDLDRENEGDLIFPAETITPDIINFMVRHGSGIVCLPITKSKAKTLGLSYMIAPHEKRSAAFTPAFTASIEAKVGVKTGVSAVDRAHTIKTAIRDDACADDLVMPGHIFPIMAQEDGVLARTGHTEGSVDLVRMAGFKPAAVLCEVMNPDGTMASGDQLRTFANTHQISILAIADIVDYRLSQENLIAEETHAFLPLEKYGDFTISVIKEKINSREHLLLEKKTSKTSNTSKPKLVRIHSTCTTGDLFASLRCDCHQQLHYSLQRISEEGGLLIYLNQEGRGIGLFNKIKAYALQEQGLDTVEANLQLGLPSDSRSYSIAANILRNLEIREIRLLTNNPAKVKDLQKFSSIKIIQETMPAFCHPQNQTYLSTKQKKLNHLLNVSVQGISQ